MKKKIVGVNHKKKKTLRKIKTNKIKNREKSPKGRYEFPDKRIPGNFSSKIQV